ncbi:universal stress protein, partial [Gemmatimonas sp.]|uniref:universal stress protein n=1 Tax=Gemmatimonas sp. TaxID=1962908 RepID=UPI003982D7C4
MESHVPETSQSIIVPLDGSALAEAAIPFAIALAQRRHLGIDLVHVHATGVRTQNAPIVDPRWDNDRSKDMGDAIRGLGERYARETGVNVSVTVLRGEPAAMLMNYATEQEAALVAMTTHGRSGFSHAWFGSVTEHVVHAAKPCVAEATSAVRCHGDERCFL